MLRKGNLTVFIYFVIFKIFILKLDFLNVAPSNALKNCSQTYFFSVEVIRSIDHLHRNTLRIDLEFFTLSKLKRNNHSLYFIYLLLLSKDISLNQILLHLLHECRHKERYQQQYKFLLQNNYGCLNVVPSLLEQHYPIYVYT